MKLFGFIRKINGPTPLPPSREGVKGGDDLGMCRDYYPWSEMIRHGGLAVRMGYERIIAARCGTVHPQGNRDRSVRKDEQETGRHGGLPLRMIIVFLVMLLVVSPVKAQEPPTRLFLNPTPLVIDTTISPTGLVTLEVADGVDIIAFDLYVQYDPALLSVSQVALGDFLGEGQVCMEEDKDPGLVHYVCTRAFGQTGVSGSGVLLELTFVANGQAGDSDLSLAGSELYYWPDAFLVDATLEDGAVSVRPYRTYLPLILSASGQGMEALR